MASIFNSAISGLNTAKQSLGVISNNMANVNTENYAKRVVNQEPIVVAGEVQGVKISSIDRDVDQVLMDSVRDQGSPLASLETLNEYYQQIQLMIGDPNSDNTITAAMNNFFSALKSLATSPSQPSLHLNAVQKGETYANILSTLSNKLQELRYKADQDIASSVNIINSALVELNKCNSSLNNLNNLNSDISNILEKRDMLLRKLATQLDVYTYYSSSNAVTVSAAQGKGLLDNTYTYTLNYKASLGKEAFINNIELEPITISMNDNNGKPVNTPPVVLVSSGVGEEAGQASTIKTDITSGKIKSLLEMRDVIIPKFLDELDNLAYTFTQEFNKIHNNGSGFPSADELSGTRPTTLDELHNWDGKVMIGLVNNKGLPVEKVDGSKLKPLTLDLSHIRSGSIDGQFSSNTIIDEINQYFYYRQVSNRLELGNLSDIKMVAYSDLSTVPNGQFTFDFELDNNDQLGSNFKVLGVTVSDPGCAGLISALPSESLVNAGELKRTSAPITVDFAGGAGGPYTINVLMEAKDNDGNASVTNVSFIVDDITTSNIENTRYTASSVLAGPGQIKLAGTTQGFAYATLIDSEGNEITDPSIPGFLNIKTDNDNYRISINELTSKELGAVNTNVADSVTQKGFSAFFELNDFFVRNPEINKKNNNPAIHNSAINISIRKDIISTPELFSMGQLIQSSTVKEQLLRGYEKASGTFTFNGNPSIGDTLQLSGKTFTFDALNSDNTIAVGLTLDDTLTNIVQVLSAENTYTAGGVDNASYTFGDNNLYISFNAKGQAGNEFMLGASFATITASINDATASNTPNGTLIGGSSTIQVIDVQPWTYQLGVSSNQIVSQLADLRNVDTHFLPAGNLIDTTVSFSYYTSTIISVHSTNASNSKNLYKNEKLVYDGYKNKLLAASGVNLDEQVANTIQYQKAYNASAKMIKIAGELDDVLMGMIK